METKRNTKVIYGAILGLAAAAFAVDRWVIGHNTEAAPAETDSVAVATAQPREAVTPSTSSAPAQAAALRTSLASRLAAAVETRKITLAAVNDVFAAPAAWSEEKVRAAAAKTPKKDPAAEFRTRHKLDAIMKTTHGGVAIVDGKSVRVGEKLEGLKLLAIDAQTASFGADGLVIQMKLPRTSAPLALARGK